MHSYIYIYIYIYIHPVTCICVKTQIYIRTFMHTYTHWSKRTPLVFYFEQKPFIMAAIFPKGDHILAGNRKQINFDAILFFIFYLPLSLAPRVQKQATTDVPYHSGIFFLIFSLISKKSFPSFFLVGGSFSGVISFICLFCLFINLFVVFSSLLFYKLSIFCYYIQHCFYFFISLSSFILYFFFFLFYIYFFYISILLLFLMTFFLYFFFSFLPFFLFQCIFL